MRALFGSALYWERQITLACKANPAAALDALLPLGPLVLQDIGLHTPPRPRVWPWAMAGASAHTTLALAPIRHHAPAVPLTPLWAPGTQGQALCGPCRDSVPTTYGHQEAADRDGQIHPIFAATCNRCGALASIPLQHAPIVGD